MTQRRRVVERKRETMKMCLCCFHINSCSVCFTVKPRRCVGTVADEAAAQREEESLLPHKLHCEAAMNVQETRGQTSRKPEKSV